MTPIERHQMQQQAMRIRARERFEWINDVTAAIFGTGQDRQDYLINIAEMAFGDDKVKLQRAYESITRN